MRLYRGSSEHEVEYESRVDQELDGTDANHGDDDAIAFRADIGAETDLATKIHALWDGVVRNPSNIDPQFPYADLYRHVQCTNDDDACG